MRSIGWIITCAAGMVPALGAGLGSAPSAGRSVCSIETVLVDTGWVSPAGEAAPCGEASVAQPPLGEGSYRPSHHTVASVMVTLERARSIRVSLLGGLHGP